MNFSMIAENAIKISNELTLTFWDPKNWGSFKIHDIGKKFEQADLYLNMLESGRMRPNQYFKRYITEMKNHLGLLMCIEDEYWSLIANNRIA